MFFSQFDTQTQIFMLGELERSQDYETTRES